jgi:hypothetical protein
VDGRVKAASRIQGVRWQYVNEFIWLKLGPMAGPNDSCDEAKSEVLMAVATDSAIF